MELKEQTKPRLRSRSILTTPVFRGCGTFGIIHSDSGTRESILQFSQHCWEAIIVKMLLKYSANYNFKHQSFFPLLFFQNYTKQELTFLEVDPRQPHWGESDSQFLGISILDFSIVLTPRGGLKRT